MTDADAAADAPDDDVIDVDPVELPVVEQALVVRDRGTAVVARDEISVADLVTQREKIQEVMQRVMKRDVHYGIIPGVKKPSLFKPGAEVLNVLFRLAPSYDSRLTWHDGEPQHLTVVSKCRLTHIPTGLVVAEGEGLCTTRESKYAYRQGGRTCPNCGVIATIKKSRFKPKDGDYEGASSSDDPGWYCFAKVGGCGMNFAATDPRIVDQKEIDRVPNEDLADVYNTVLKMGDKRALVAAILNGTAASDVFTQDVEDTRGSGGDGYVGEAAPDAAKPVTWETVDPATQMHPDAPRGWKEIFELLTWIDGGLDWPDVVRQAFAGCFGQAARADLTDEQAQAAGRRLANVAGWLRDVAMEGKDFPPPTDMQVVQAFRWGFGVDVTIPVARAAGEDVLDDEARAALAAEDIPFGES